MDGGQIIGGLISGGFGLLSNALAEQRESEARSENYKYNEWAAQNADARTRALYEDYQTPEALLRQYQAAGLSPSLMFGEGGGAGGMTQGAQGSGAAGISPTSYEIDPMKGAQLGLIEAQARKLNAEADTEEGKNARGKLQLAAQTLQNESKEYENYVKSNTMQFDIEQAHQLAIKYAEQANNLYWNTQHAKIDFDFKSETYTSRVNTEKEKFTNLAMDTLLKQSEQKLNEQQAAKLRADIAQGWEALRLKAQEIANSGRAIDNQNEQWQRECQQFRDKLAQDMTQFNKNLTYNYVKLGADTISKLASGGITGLILHAIPK